MRRFTCHAIRAGSRSVDESGSDLRSKGRTGGSRRPEAQATVSVSVGEGAVIAVSWIWPGRLRRQSFAGRRLGLLLELT